MKKCAVHVRLYMNQIGGWLLILAMSLSLLFVSCTTTPVSSVPKGFLQRRIDQLVGQSTLLKANQQGPFRLFTLPIPFIPGGHFGIQNLTKGPDGSIWFTQGDDNLVGHLTSAGRFTMFSLPGPSEGPGWITAGPDGALWFAEGIDRIERITPDGALTTFFLPTSDVALYENVVGSDGALWFTELLSHKIARLTTQGVFTEFPVKINPAALVAGLHDDLWFIENAGGKIGRMTLSGKESDFVLPLAVEGDGLVLGPDGNLWFTTDQTVTNQIGRMTLDGHFTFFSLDKNDNAIQLANAGDNSLVFTEADSNAIGFINLQGQITAQVSIPQSEASPFAITARVPGEYWFTEIGTDPEVGKGFIGILTLPRK